MTWRTSVFAAAAVAALLLLAACGGGSKNPASPSTPSAPGSTGGASISGTVTGGATGSSVGTSRLSTGPVAVTVAGTGITATTDGTGRFVLGGVPAGTVQLNFSTSGAQGSVTLTDVQASDQINITVTLRPSGASLDSEQRNGSSKVEIEGLITAVNPAGSSSRTLDVNGSRVSVPGSAVIRHGDTPIDFGTLKVGDRVHVRGVPTTGIIVADLVMLQNDGNETQPPADQTVEIEGRVTAKDAGARSLLVDSTMVTVAPNADIRHGDTPVAFDAINVGDRVHVKGTKSGDTVVATQVIVQNDNPNVPVNAQGAISGLTPSPSCPSVRFTLEGWTIETNASTSFEKGSCGSLANGTNVHVKGATQSSGRVLASSVQVGK